MKTCKTCQFKDERTIDVNGRFVPGVWVCTHEECVDPIQGDPLMCNQARTNPHFCSIEARYHKIKVVEEKKPEANVIQISK